MLHVTLVFPSFMHNYSKLVALVQYIQLESLSYVHTDWPPIRVRRLLHIPLFSFCCTSKLVAFYTCTVMADNSPKNFDNNLQARFLDPAKRFELWQWMNSVPDISTTPGGTVPGVVTPHLTPSGMAQGAGSTLLPPAGMLPAGFHGTPMWWPPFLPFFTSFQMPFPAPQLLSTMSKSTSSLIPGPSQIDINLSNADPDHAIHREKEDTDDELIIQDPKQDSLFDPSIKSPVHGILLTKCTNF